MFYVFDFRGIGESLHENLKILKPVFKIGACWIFPIEYLLQRTQKSQVLMIGHSAGGQLLGVVPNYHRVAKLVAVQAQQLCQRLKRSNQVVRSCDV